jgi:hypothetical protein
MLLLNETRSSLNAYKKNDKKGKKIIAFNIEHNKRGVNKKLKSNKKFGKDKKNMSTKT